MTTQTEALKLALELLAVGTFHSPELQAKRTEVIEQGLNALAQPEQKPVAQSRPFTKKQRDTLCTVYAIASASTTANSLPNIAKIVDELLTEDLEVQPKEPEQEPVAWMQDTTCGLYVIDHPDEWHCFPLYTTPPQRKPLTDDEILSIARDHYNPHQRPEISFACAIEAAHGIKE